MCLGLLSAFLGCFDFSKYSLDDPLPPPPSVEGWQSRQALFVELAQRERLSIRQLYQRITPARGHHTPNPRS